MKKLTHRWIYVISGTDLLNLYDNYGYYGVGPPAFDIIVTIWFVLFHAIFICRICWTLTFGIAIWSHRSRISHMCLCCSARGFRETLMAPYRDESKNSPQEQNPSVTAAEDSEISSGRLVYGTLESDDAM